MLGALGDAIRRRFISGVIVTVPLILTFLVLRFLFQTIDGILSPMLRHALGYTVPGLGLLTTFLLILLAGILTRNIVGSRLFRSGDRVLRSFPLVRVVYLAARQLVEGVTLPQKRAFKEVALVEYPRRGAYAMCFVVQRPALISENGETSLLSLFIPSTPTPISGMVIMVRPEEVILLDISVEEAFKFLVSGGIVSPDAFRGRILGAGATTAPPGVAPEGQESTESDLVETNTGRDDHDAPGDSA